MSMTLEERIRYVASHDPANGKVTAYAEDFVELLDKAKIDNKDMLATADALLAGLKDVFAWLDEHQPVTDESFYRVDHVDIALPELGMLVYAFAVKVGWKPKGKE